MIDQLLSEVATYTMTCIFMSCVWGFTPLAVPLICMAGTTGGTQITFDTYLTSHIYRVGATVSIRHDFQPPGLLIQTSQRQVIQTPLMMCFLVHSHLESTQRYADWASSGTQIEEYNNRTGKYAEMKRILKLLCQFLWFLITGSQAGTDFNAICQIAKILQNFTHKC